MKPRIFHTTMLIGSNDESWISSKNKDFIDKIFYKEKFKSIELEPTIQLMKDMGEALNSLSAIPVQQFDYFNNEQHTLISWNNDYSLKVLDVIKARGVLEKYSKFLEGIEK